MTFSFNATAPATAGTYNFKWQMVDGAAYFGQQSTNVAVTSGFDSAQFVSQDVPASMVPGATYPVSVTMKNTSNIYWAPSTVSLGSQNPDNNTTWGMSNVALTSYIAPGANAIFTFNVTAPATLGTHNFQWRLLKGAGNWIGPATPNVAVLISADEAAFVSQSVPATMQPGKVYSATITLRNTGVSTWSTTALHRLGSQNPQDNTTWGLSRADLPGDVPPGASVTIPIDVVAPATAGTYNFQWRLVHGTTWFGVTTPNVAVNVGSLGSPVAGMQFIHVDHLNTPREIYDASSQLRWRWDQLEPFGVNVPDENPSSLGAFEFALRFPGQYFDKETNLAYNWSRDFDSTLGRYMQSDPIGLAGGLNSYGYVLGRPLTLTDPNGLGPEIVVLPLVGLAAVLAIANSSTVSKPKNLPANLQSLWDRFCANSDDPCAAIQAEIQNTMEKMRNLRATMLADPRNLFSAATTVPNPAVTGTSTTWANHVTNYERQRTKLAELIILASKIPCTVPADAFIEVNVGAPTSPRLVTVK